MFQDNSIGENSPTPQSEPKYYSLWAIISFIILPPLWFLIIPALVFSSETKQLYSSGSYQLAQKYSEKTKRFLIAAWAIAITIILAASALWAILHLSLI